MGPSFNGRMVALQASGSIPFGSTTLTDITLEEFVWDHRVFPNLLIYVLG